MYSIKRNIEPVIERRAKNSKAILLTGPRQVGKSTLFKHLFNGVNHVIVELDGLSLREINGSDFIRHFVPTEEYINEREKDLKKFDGDIWNIIHRGSFPELYVNTEREWVRLYACMKENSTFVKIL